MICMFCILNIYGIYDESVTMRKMKSKKKMMKKSV